MITLLNKFDDNYVMKEEDILKVIAAYLIENKVEPYLHDVFFDSNISHVAQYNLKDKIIVFNDKKIIHSAYRLYDKLTRKFAINEDHYTYFLNFYYLFITYHELTHVSQQSRYENNNDNHDLFSYLYELCSKIRKSDLSFYNHNHDMFPMEIEANNNGYFNAYNLLIYTKLPSKECKILYLQYLHSLALNYQRINNYQVIPPIEKFIKSDNESLKKINELLDSSKLSKLERMDWGLAIAPKEFDSIEKEKKKILIRL